MTQELSTEELVREVRAALRATPEEESSARQEALVWLALAPEWPESMAGMGFPISIGDKAIKTLQELAEDGWVDCADAAPPSSGKTYKMRRAQRRKVLQVAQSRARTVSGTMLEQAFSASRVFLAARGSRKTPYPLLIQYWCSLLEPTDDKLPTPLEIAGRLESGVQRALAQARDLELGGSPEAAIWIDAAEPLAAAIGGPVRGAWSRSHRALELYHRRIRDKKLLENYLDRRRLDVAFERLLADEEHWALHFIGLGGSGKTMFLRHLQSVLASKHELATARVDFDHLNPNYPLRSPGALLLSFAEELKLEAPEAAIDLFRKLVAVVNSVHGDLEAAQRGGKEVPLGFDAPGFSYCLQLFIDALVAIQRAGRQPVLILDTCEELARLRFDKELPRSVAETFRVLEFLHDGVKRESGQNPLRIVFSGRRPLASSGAGWLWKNEALPARDYLQICPIRGFTRIEAQHLLWDYHLRRDGEEEFRVPRPLFNGILELSKNLQEDEFARLVRDPTIIAEENAAASAEQNLVEIQPESDQSNDARYNPYDIELYASWAATGGIRTSDELRRAGRHHYVRERIVARLREDIQRWLAHITILERFDEELIRDLTALGDGAGSLWAEICQQEWTEVDRSISDIGDKVSLTFWSVDPKLRERLEWYFIDEEPNAWAEGRRQVADVLEKITIERDWALLTPRYFVVCTEMLGEHPLRAAQWWHSVEAKILHTEAWDWAEQITAALLDASGPIGPSASDATSHPLDAPIRALWANIQMRSSLENESLDSIWEGVRRSADAYPDESGSRLLDFRARVGLVSSLRYRSENLSERYVHRFQELLMRVRPLEEVLQGLELGTMFFRQALHTEMALLDNCAEITERVQWSSSTLRDVVDLIVGRAAELSKRLDRSRWIDLYVQRITLAGNERVESFVLPQDWVSQSRGDTPKELEEPAFDWVHPKTMETRRLLEYGRILEASQQFAYAEEFYKESTYRLETPHNLDEDRLLSQALRLRGTSTKEFNHQAELFRSSLGLTQQREECQAHRKVPPLYVTSMQVAANEGSISAVLETLSEARSSQLPPTSLRWLDGLAEYLNRSFLLLAAPARAEITVPELPAKRYFPHAVTGFMNETAANLTLARTGKLSEKDLGSMDAKAAVICAEQHFAVPQKAEDLDQLPKGWGPWFARYLLVHVMSVPRTDTALKAEIKGYLDTLYPAGLPEDVAFLGDTRTKPIMKWFDWLILPALLVATIYSGSVAVRWAASHLFDARLGWLQSFLILIGLLFGVGLLSVLLPALMRRATAWCDMTSLVEPKPGGGFEVITRTKVLRWVVSRQTTMTAHSLHPAENYKDTSIRVGGEQKSAQRHSVASRAFYHWILHSCRLPHTISVPQQDVGSAALCWEAAFGMRGGGAPSFAECAFVFRRIGGRPGGVNDPFPGTMTVLSVSASRDLTSWGQHLPDSEHFIKRSARRLTESPDPGVGVLILQAEVVGDQERMQFSVEPSSTRTFRANDIARLFPNLRLFVLFGLDRSEAARRTASDRISAGMARSGAANLFLSGIPAVVSVPSLPLPSELTEEVLKILARVIAKKPANARRRLQFAVRTIQDIIFAKSGLSPEDATELAYDVCFYSSDSVNMKVNPPTHDPNDAPKGRKGRRDSDDLKLKRERRAAA